MECFTRVFLCFILVHGCLSCFHTNWCDEAEFFKEGSDHCTWKDRVKEGQEFCVVQRHSFTDGSPMRYRAISPSAETKQEDICFDYGVSPVSKDEFMLCSGSSCNTADATKQDKFYNCELIGHLYGATNTQEEVEMQEGPDEEADLEIPVVVIKRNDNGTFIGNYTDKFKVSSKNSDCPKDFDDVRKKVFGATMGELVTKCPSAEGSAVYILATYCNSASYPAWVSASTKVDGILQFCDIEIKEGSPPKKKKDKDEGFFCGILGWLFC